MKMKLDKSRSRLTAKSSPVAPVQAYGMTITPVARAVTLRCGSAGATWARPKEVVVERDGTQTTTRIRDVTRCIQLLIMATAMFAALFLWIAMCNRKETRDGLKHG